MLASFALVLTGLVSNPAQADEPATPTADLVFTDDFERPDGVVGNGWTPARGSWGIQAGEARATAVGPQNNVLAQDGVDLGARWSVEADLRIAPYSPATGREWGGVAGNIQQQANGALGYYLLRLTTAASSGQPNTGRWHVLKMTNNATVQVLAEGTFTGPASAAGHEGVTARLSREGNELTASIATPQGESLLDRAVTVQPDVSLVGGRAGLYTVTDNLRADSVEIRTSTPAVRPPGALECDAEAGSYTFPTSGNEVIDTSDLGITWAGMFVVQDLLTRGDDQYVGFYDVDRNMVIAHRNLPDGEWSYRVLDSRIVWDSHNYISLGLDRQDTLHVSGNMHNVRLNYWRSAPGGDISTLERQATMVSPETENRVTYPEFVNRKDGSLVFNYRNGGSGSGVTYFNVYDEKAGSWGRLVDAPYFDGLGSADNPSGTWNAYHQGPTLGPDGMFHMLWVWRDTPDAATNSLLTYAKSENLVDWVDATGKPLTTPFRYGEGDVVDPVPDRAGLLNGNARIGFTADDEILISYHKYDEDGHSQVYAATPEGEAWKISQISDWEGRWSFGGGGTLIFEVQMLGSEVLADGNVQVNLLCSGDAQSIVIDQDLQPLAQADTPALPGGLSEVRSDYPGMQVSVMKDRGDVPEPATDRGRYLLRWETLPENRDLPRSEWPRDGSPIQVVLVGDSTPAAPAPTGTLTTSVTSPTTERSFPVTLTFDQDVTGLELGDLAVTNGSAGDLTGSGASYQFVVTAAADGEVGVSVPADAVVNAEGTGNEAVAALRTVVEPAAPTTPLSARVLPVSGDNQRAVLRLELAGDGAAGATVTATSSNSRLLPQRAITVSGRGEQRQLVISPVARWSGTSTVTLRVADGSTVTTTTVDVHAGGARADRLVGGPGVDVMFGRGGNDVLVGGGGDDLLIGGPGNDELRGGAGHDVLEGGPGRDRLFGGAGDDVLRGGAGNDLLDGGAGDDRLFGGPGRDVLRGGPGDDVLTPGPGRSTLIGGAGADVFRANQRQHLIVDFNPRQGDTRLA